MPLSYVRIGFISLNLVQASLLFAAKWLDMIVQKGHEYIQEHFILSVTKKPIRLKAILKLFGYSSVQGHH